MSSYLSNLRFSDRQVSEVSADPGDETFTETFTETKSCAIGRDGIRINYDLDTITPKYFEMTKDGVVFQETGQPTYTTGLGRLCAVQQAFQAVELPPNATTLKINDTLLCDAGVVNQTTSITDGQITINGTGLNNNPLLSLNTGSGNGILYQEVYNQRTAQTGEFSRMSFYAKNSAGTKTEFGRIHQNAPIITAGSVKGRMDFAVGNSAGLSDYLSLNANTAQVDILNSDLDLNSNDIVSATSITTPLNNQYSKEQVVYLTANATAPTGSVESNLRYTAINLGKPATWIEATSITTSGFLSGVENITASQNGFLGAWWVGTESGNVYYSFNGGASWTYQGSYGGRIRCFQSYASGSFLAVGGDFTGLFSYLFATIIVLYLACILVVRLTIFLLLLVLIIQNGLLTNTFQGFFTLLVILLVMDFLAVMLILLHKIRQVDLLSLVVVSQLLHKTLIQQLVFLIYLLFKLWWDTI